MYTVDEVVVPIWMHHCSRMIYSMFVLVVVPHSMLVRPKRCTWLLTYVYERNLLCSVWHLSEELLCVRCRCWTKATLLLDLLLLGLQHWTKGSRLWSLFSGTWILLENIIPSFYVWLVLVCRCFRGMYMWEGCKPTHDTWDNMRWFRASFWIIVSKNLQR